jgi:flavin reductase (DIM6/NTAB) family NADH-FMN oxidoreductase RutF
MERKAFTVSLPSEDYVKQADYFGMVSGRDEDKFSKAKLTAVKGDLVDAPFVKEFPLVLECKLQHSFEIGLHTEFIGEILDVKADEECLGSDGLSDIEKIRPILFSPDRRLYHGVGRLLGKAFSVGREV